MLFSSWVVRPPNCPGVGPRYPRGAEACGLLGGLGLHPTSPHWRLRAVRALVRCGEPPFTPCPSAPCRRACACGIRRGDRPLRAPERARRQRGPDDPRCPRERVGSAEPEAGRPLRAGRHAFGSHAGSRWGDFSQRATLLARRIVESRPGARTIFLAQQTGNWSHRLRDRFSRPLGCRRWRDHKFRCHASRGPFQQGACSRRAGKNRCPRGCAFLRIPRCRRRFR